MDQQIDCSLKLAPKIARQKRANAFLLNFFLCAIFHKLNSASHATCRNVIPQAMPHATCHSANSFRPLSLPVFLGSCTVRVKGGMSLWNGMWHGLRKDIIMRNVKYGNLRKEIN